MTNDRILLREGNKEITDEYDIAQEMNCYFSYHEQSILPEFDNFIDDKLSNILCNANEVENHLKELNAHKSQGPDMISPSHTEGMNTRTVNFIVHVI